MLIFYLRLSWHLDSVHSLKEKRSHVQAVLSHLRRRYNISAIESAHRDKWQRIEIEICGLVRDKAMADRQIESIIAAVDAKAEGDVLIEERHML